MRSQARSLLYWMVKSRCLTHAQARAALRARAASLGIPRRHFDVSQRHFIRLINGEVARPHPILCRVLEAEFNRPIADLLSVRLLVADQVAAVHRRAAIDHPSLGRW